MPSEGPAGGSQAGGRASRWLLGCRLGRVGSQGGHDGFSNTQLACGSGASVSVRQKPVVISVLSFCSRVPYLPPLSLKEQ